MKRHSLQKLLLLICISSFPALLFAQSENERPKIGLALSGGGAKGLAHIGLLMAIDSAGINIDYVSGTSMGAIVGGLYAAGYSGKEIASFTKEMNWNRILTNKPEYDQLLLPYKEYNSQFKEVPIINKKIYFGKGVLESNELWLWLSEKFSAYNNDTDFADLPIPFRCIATRLDDGKAVVLSKGNLIKAIRASMSIPAIFTPVNIDSTALIDGGLVRNFPVSDVRNMGASLVIGSSVAEHQLTINDLNSPFKILTQIAFFSEKKDFRKQVKNTDILVEYPIEKYNTGSFSSADDILQLGIKKGREMIPILKKLKDSLDQIYGYQPPRKLKPTTEKQVHIRKIIPKGLSSEDWPFYSGQMELKENKTYTIRQISRKIRNAYASGNFRKITYSFTQNDDATSDMHLNFQKNVKTYLLGGISYNDETGIGIKLGAAWNDVLGLFSTSSIALSIGENPQFGARNINFLGRSRKSFVETTVKGELSKLNYFNQNLATIGAFRQNHLAAEINLARLFTRNFQVGFGGRWDYLTYRPEIQTEERPKGVGNFLTTFFRLKYNNQDKPYYPMRGNNINIEAGRLFSHRPKFTYMEDGKLEPTPLKLQQDGMYSLSYYSSHYLSIKKSTLFARLSAGILSDNQLPFLHNFSVGGTNFITANQVLFPGFRVNSISTSSAASGQVGIRQNISQRFNASVGFNALWYDFLDNNIAVTGQSGHYATGENLTLGFESWLGPLEITLMHNSISDRFFVSFSFGYSLNFSK